MQEEKTSQRLRAVIRHISNLPTLPIIASQVMELLRNPRTPVRELARVISSDQSLTTAVLKLVNSAYYGFPRQISTVKHALVILGFNEIRNIAFTISILRSFPRGKKSPFFDYQAFWRHCLGCAVTAKMLAKFFRYRISGKVFVAGLVHDIGKILLSGYAKDLFEQVIQEVTAHKISLYQAEKNVLGVTHAEIGSWLAYQWNFPQEIEEVIKFHHLPSKSKINPPLCSVIHLSDVLVRMKSIGWGGDEKIPPLHPAVWKLLQPLRPDLSRSHLKYFIVSLEEEMERAKPLFDILG
jgi:putative nucleotidyltransferase with HDIG domain